MSVIINEFEVVVQPESAESSEANADTSTEAEQSEVPQMSPQDLRNIMHQQYQRMLRVYAD